MKSSAVDRGVRDGPDLAALFIAEKLAAQLTLVLVPSVSFLAQMLRE
jgi:predicted helicase